MSGYFDRWDVCAAYHMFAVLWNGGQPASSYGVRLSRIGYRPAPSEQTLEGLSPNAKAIYGSLVRKHERLYTGFDRLYRRHPDVAGSWPGTRNMPGGNARAWLQARGLLGAVESMVQP